MSTVRTQRAARLVFRLRLYDHVSDTLAILHWLRLPERVNFQLAFMAYRVLNGVVPPYLNQLVLVSSLTGRRRLRSSFTLQLDSRRTVCQQPAVARFLSQPPFSGTLCLHQMMCSMHRLPLPLLQQLDIFVSPVIS